jgi:hypothetical protein
MGREVKSQTKRDVAFVRNEANSSILVAASEARRYYDPAGDCFSQQKALASQ